MALFGKKKKPEGEGDGDPKPKKGIVGRLLSGLSRTVSAVVGGITRVVVGRRIDEDLIDDVEEVLYEGDLGTELVEQVIDQLRQAWKRKEIAEGEEVIPFLKNQFKSLLTSKSNEIPLQESGPTVILVVGVNGTGKTTSIGKLAYHFKSLDKKVMVVAGDTFRAAAENQLRVWAEERVQCEFHQGNTGDKPSTVAYTAAERALAENVDVLIVDTAGRLHTDRNLMEQLAKVKRVLSDKIPGSPHEVLLVLDANVGQNALAQTEGFLDSAGVTGLFLAKLDATGKGGVVLNIHQRYHIPVKFVGLGEQMTDYAPFDAEQFVEALFSEEAAAL